MIVEFLEMHARWSKMTPHRPPLHVVFIEEPEAHLHTQLQQVFIKQILEIPALQVVHPYIRQFVITTHSPHILYYRGFSPIRYFRRQLDLTSQVLNLTSFEEDAEADEVEFLRRYVKLTHCDLFFADAAILVEGNVERLLLPLMIEKAARGLTSSHLSIIEISGAFAHRFRRLLEFLGIPTLIITDLDSVEATAHRKTCPPDAAGAITSNQTLTQWLPGRTTIADLLATTPSDLTSARHTTARGRIHVTYQQSVEVNWGGATERRTARTLEEAFALDNLSWTQDEANRAIGLYIEDSTSMDLPTLARGVFDHVTDRNFKKTDFALALLAAPENQWQVPNYITRGLQWLDGELNATVPLAHAGRQVVEDAAAPHDEPGTSPAAPIVAADGIAQELPSPPVPLSPPLPPAATANAPSVGPSVRSTGGDRARPQLDLDL